MGRRSAPRLRTRLLAAVAVLAAAALVATLSVAAATRTASAALEVRTPSATTANPYRRGPAPTGTGIAAARGTFATAETTIARGNGFGGGVVYYPTDTRQGTFGAIVIAPEFGIEWRWYSWLGPRLASFGFVVVGIETDTLDDGADQLLAALDWLVTSSPVRDRVDRGRLAVGGGGALVAGARRPSLKTAIGLAPFRPGWNLSDLRIPTMLFAGQTDGTVTPADVKGMYSTIPANVERAYVEIAGEGHGFPAGGGGGNSAAFARVLLVWTKVFLDYDTRYGPFLCPSLTNTTGTSGYQASCPFDPPASPQWTHRPPGRHR